MIWPVPINWHTAWAREHHDGFGIRSGGQAQEQRAAQTVLATMDHADIRGLVTAFHLSVAGLPAL
jgi:hypothetical protein